MGTQDGSGHDVADDERLPETEGDQGESGRHDDADADGREKVHALAQSVRRRRGVPSDEATTGGCVRLTDILSA